MNLKITQVPGKLAGLDVNIFDETKQQKTPETWSHPCLSQQQGLRPCDIWRVGALHVLYTVSKCRVPITPQIILKHEWGNALWVHKENIFLSSLGKRPHVHSDRFNVLKGLLNVLKGLLMAIDSGRATAHGMLCVPSLTSAFSVSKTFCPLISRWITLCWCRWLRPWRKERRES